MNSKKTVEALMLGGALVVSLGGLMSPMVANAATICNLSTDGNGSVGTGDTSSFVKVDFKAKCSPNTSSEGGGGARNCGGPTNSDASAVVADPAAAATDGCV